MNRACRFALVFFGWWAFASVLYAETAQVIKSDGAILRVLDRIAGKAADIILENEEHIVLGHLFIKLYECRYFSNDPRAEAYVLLEIKDVRAHKMKFQGWMLASSPALNPLDHARYDVWAVRCFMP